MEFERVTCIIGNCASVFWGEFVVVFVPDCQEGICGVRVYLSDDERGAFTTIYCCVYGIEIEI